jgi:ParB family chromosome partitioning protein
MGLKELARQRSDIFWIDPRALNELQGWNARQDDAANREHIETLARSIAAVGVLEPLTVFNRDGKIWLSDGHCRLAATMLAIQRGADIKNVPVKTEARGASERDFALRQITDGKPKTPYELALVCKRLIGYGWTVADIAERSGKTAQTINAALDLLEATPVVQDLVATGRISATLAAKTIKAKGSAKASEALANAVDAAAQKGRAKATARDVGEAPTPKVNRLTRLAEIFLDDALVTFDDENAGEGYRLIEMSEATWREIAKLLNI